MGRLERTRWLGCMGQIGLHKVVGWYRMAGGAAGGWLGQMGVLAQTGK